MKSAIVPRVRHVSAAILLALALAPCGASGRRGGEDGRAVTVSPDGRMRIRLDGVEVFARVGPGMPSTPYLSRGQADKLFGPDAARIDQEQSSKALFAIRPYTNVNVGPRTVKGNMRTVRLEVAGQWSKATARWFEADAFQGDALLGPWAVPATKVGFDLGPGSAADLRSTLPLADRRSWWVANTVLRIGGKDVRFAFAPQFPRTVASAAAGALLVREHGGGFVGKFDRTVLQHGVDRPVRSIRLARPLRIGSLALENMLVRTADYRGAAGLPEVGIDPSEASDEIVVTGRRPTSKPAYLVYLGADLLSRCSSILFDKRAKSITLACRG